MKRIMKNEVKNIRFREMSANAITGCRIILSLAMIFFPVFSSGFYVCYLAAGFTDMVDGTIARKLGTDSKLGAKLDTAADIVFAAVSLFRVLPAIQISTGIWIWTGLIGMIKIFNVVYGFLKQKQFAAVHSIGNKLTGIALFVFPFSLSVIDIKYSSVFVCMLATFAAIQESCFIRSNAGC